MVDGVWDGQIQEIKRYDNEEFTYFGSLAMGYWNVIKQSEDSYTVLKTQALEGPLTGSEIGVYEDGLQIQQGIWGFTE